MNVLSIYIYANLFNANDTNLMVNGRLIYIILYIISDNWIRTHINVRSARGKNSFGIRMYPPPSLSLFLSTSIPHSPGGGQCLGGGHISSTLGGGRGGRSKKSYRAKTIISAW